ncbi:DNA repair protein [Echinicola strongylocentroti]|uniref:DNA repair protein n=1 Tax=Echinicola strongylocentroti TaxID=1795355 RepID=A0A2Z4IRN6_9BACT|nr:JAB domain-containing protein [Echinicola strongylocentroti]AWW33236.1 DNA repair protein [Echinicola strongylocentroti]
MKNLFNTIGEVKATYKTTGKPFAQITGSKDAATLLRELWDQDTIEYYESFCVLMLNRANKVIAYRFVGQGGTSGVIADPKTIFQAALLANSSALIVAHNHPSGQLKPSRQDLNLTEKVKLGGDFLDIHLLDHIIITADGHYSMADNGEL